MYHDYVGMLIKLLLVIIHSTVCDFYTFSKIITSMYIQYLITFLFIATFYHSAHVCNSGKGHRFLSPGLYSVSLVK